MHRWARRYEIACIFPEESPFIHSRHFCMDNYKIMFFSGFGKKQKVKLCYKPNLVLELSVVITRCADTINKLIFNFFSWRHQPGSQCWSLLVLEPLKASLASHERLDHRARVAFCSDENKINVRPCGCSPSVTRPTHCCCLTHPSYLSPAAGRSAGLRHNTDVFRDTNTFQIYLQGLYGGENKYFDTLPILQVFRKSHCII